MAQTGFKLIFIEGHTPGAVIELNREEFILGREESTDVHIPSPAVSRRHACIRIRAGRVTLEDLNSSNGTFVNGRKIQGSVDLHPGDRISLGRSIIIALEGPPEDHPAQATIIEGMPPVIPPAPVTPDKVETVVRMPRGQQPPPPPAQQPIPPNQQQTQYSSQPPAVPHPQAAGDSMHTVIGVPQQAVAAPTQLEVTIAGGKPVFYTLAKPRYTIGRNAENDIVISSPIVSRHHAILEKTQYGYRLEVLKDVTNPILRDGRPLTEPVTLHHQAKMRIGGEDPGMMVTLRYLAPSEAVAAPPMAVNFGQKDRIMIGRDPSNDVTLDSPLVSRFHAQIERVGQRYRLTDLRSANGTFVNDKRIEGVVWLQPQDMVRVGPSRFVMGQNALVRQDETKGLQVEMVGLNKWVRKDLNLLKNISLVFHPREFVVVVGQSGGGKSTLVDAVAGYRPATQGSVFVNGTNVYKNFDAIRNEIGYVPQKDIIHMELTVWQALDYAAKLRMPPDTTREEREKRIEEVLDDLDLTHRKDVQISGLSGGQQKRVSIGVELLTSPGLFFLDEPTSGLDPGTETSLMQLMRRLADRGRTIILITHATKNVMLADKVVFLARGGHLAWFGPPDEALEYFDQFRSDRDRRTKSIEFDTIYAILDDSSKGSPEEWGKRFKEHPAYQKYIRQPLAELGHSLDGQSKPLAPVVSKTTEIARKVSRKQVSALRQFFILSARNARILTRDKPAMMLMLAVAPIVSMLDVILSFVLGRDLGSYLNGNVALGVTGTFMPIMYSVMVGALAQMREFVKESEIYKRERLVNLKVLPYVLSKVWVAALIALYQSLVYTVVHTLAFEFTGTPLDLLFMYATLYLATLAGMMLGLASSALAPNGNAVPLIVIMFLIPQFTLGGAMIPVPDYVSAPMAARWTFEALMSISGAGSDVMKDACWELPEELRDNMTLEDKAAAGCNCMGIAVLRQESCEFPGIGKFYKPVIDQPEPIEPQDIGDPPPDPVIPPAPEEPEDTTDQVVMAEYLLKLQDYQKEVEKIQDEYKRQVEEYQNLADIYEKEMEDYQEAKSTWEVERNQAVSEAEGLIDSVYKDFKWSFVDKSDPKLYYGKIFRTWASQGIIISVLLVLTILLIWRKDKVK